MDKFRIDYLKLNPPLAFLVACSIPILIASLRWYHHGRDISIFILAGDEKVDKNLHPFDIKIYENSTGYDGQYFYQLALDPFSADEKGYGISSNYDYRKQRIFYPLLVYCASLGNPKVVPFMMVFVNLIAFFISFYFISKILFYYKVNPGRLLLWAIFTGLYVSFCRNLSEVCALMMTIMSLYYWSIGKIKIFSITMLCALFTRDETILILAPFWLHILWISSKKSRVDVIDLIFLSIPILAILTWKWHLISHYGVYKPTQLTFLPASGIFHGLKLGWLKAQYNSKFYLYFIYSLGYLTWHFWTTLYAFKNFNVRKIDFRFLLSICLLIWTIFVLFFNSDVYSDDVGYARIFSSLTLVGFLLITLYERKINPYYIFYTVGTFIVVSIKIIFLL